jgi:hypothetical protein
MLDFLKDYAYKKADLLKMQATEKSVSIIGILAISLFLAVSGLFFMILLFIGLGFLIGHYIHNYGFGLLIVAGFHLLTMIIIFLSRNAIKNFIADKIIQLLED